jgi:chaperonin GroES
MIKPIGDWVLVKAQPTDDISEGGIIVPDSCKKDGCKMTIVAVGEGSENNPMQFEPNTTAFRVKDWGIEVEYEHERMYFMRQQDILATM